MVEYYFQDQLRWSFGFENPNKAAALVATLLPLIWVFAQLGWKVKRPALRWPLVMVGSGVLCAGWWSLFMTFSRGGIVAALAGFLYIGWKEGGMLIERENRPRLVVALASALLIASLFIGTNAAERSTQWVAKSEGSVVNRFDLWRGGLEMVAEIPQGVGRGKSGEAYMQWFQPLDSTTRYRTLVNSYLTFAVEQGLPVFGAALFLTILFWCGTARPMANKRRKCAGALATGARGSLAAFAIAGFFSTTMEEWRLWIIPGIEILLLIVAAFRYSERASTRFPVQIAITGSLAGCAALYAIGCILGTREPVKIAYSGEKVRVRPSSAESGLDLVVWVDDAVLGEDYGKLLRRLVMARRAVLHMNGALQNQDQVLVATGETVSRISSEKPGRALVLIAPVRIESGEARDILRKAKSVTLFTSSFDDDGRVACWRGAAAETKVKPLELEGVGSQVEWAWDQVVKQL